MCNCNVRESTTIIASMDSGQPLRGFRNDEATGVWTHLSQQFLRGLMQYHPIPG
jgi:hypothetical protein